MAYNFSEQAPVFGLDIEVGEYDDHKQDRQYHTEGQLKTDFAIEHTPPTGALTYSNLSVFLSTARDIGSNKQTAPKNTTKASTRDLLFQRYLHR